MENKRKNIYIIIFVITTIVAACLAVYFKVDGDRKVNSLQRNLQENTLSQNNEETKSEEVTKLDENKTTERIVTEYKFYPDIDSSKCINSQGKYAKRISYEFIPLACVVNSDNKTANLTTDWSYATKVWGFVPNGGNGIYENKEVKNFSNEIVDVISTGWGQTADYSTLLFLMKDGSVEYIPVYKAYKTGNFASYGKINGVSDIVYIGNATVNNYNAPIAMKTDGSFYDLSYILKDTGNYSF